MHTFTFYLHFISYSNLRESYQTVMHTHGHWCLNIEYILHKQNLLSGVSVLPPPKVIIAGLGVS
jgi:hypothetical protein